MSASGVGAQCRPSPGRVQPAGLRRVAGAAERRDSGRGPSGSGGRLGGGEQRVGLGRAAHGLGGVVDQDVERALRGDGVGERDDLARVAQVDADDRAAGRSQSALSGIAVKRRTASLGKRVVMVVWAPSRSSRSAMYMPIFARPPVSSARRPVRSVRASRRAWLQRRAGRAELVVEGVDLVVALLADVAGARLDQRAGGRALRRSRCSGRPWVSSSIRPGRGGRGRGGDGAVVRPAIASRRSAPAPLLDGLEEPARGPLDGDRVGVVDGQRVELREHAQAGLELLRIDSVRIAGNASLSGRLALALRARWCESRAGVEQPDEPRRPGTSAGRPDSSTAERLFYRERVLLDRQIELYRMRYLAARPGHRAHARVEDPSVRP